ncbi:MAG: HEPN domain-containing protein [Thermoplasmata archaeon]|nr:HEPN domain-containing protein [Thermoplasmata archaeon]
MENGLANVASVNAVQAAISANDAFLVHYLGQRSAGSDHHDALRLLAGAAPPVRREIGHHLQRVLNRKTEVEYQDRNVSMRDAQELAKHARRLIDIVRRELEP